MVCLSLCQYFRLDSIVSKSRIDIGCLKLLIAREQLCQMNITHSIGFSLLWSLLQIFFFYLQYISVKYSAFKQTFNICASALTKGQHTSDQKIIFQFDYIILLNGVYFSLYVFSLVCQSSCSLILPPRFLRTSQFPRPGPYFGLFVLMIQKCHKLRRGN